MELRIRYSINLHKALTIPVCLMLMVYYNSFGYRAYLYLALHGTYIILWFCKELCFPDKSWEREVNMLTFVAAFLGLGPLGYWIGMALAIRNKSNPSPELMFLAVSMQLLGVFFHFTADAQKHFTLKYRPGLIQDGLFSKCRNTNYLGEFLIYLSFSVVSGHWLPLLIHILYVCAVYSEGITRKEKSLSRYPEFEAYRRRTWMFVPKPF